jgi:hypothetical protein
MSRTAAERADMRRLTERVINQRTVNSQTIRTGRSFANLAWHPSDRYGCTLWVIGKQEGLGDVDVTLALTTEEMRNWRDFLEVLLEVV